jgi:hypothetical protein
MDVCLFIVAHVFQATLRRVFGFAINTVVHCHLLQLDTDILIRDDCSSPEPLPFSDTSVVRKSDLYLARLAWPDKANSLGARLPKALWGRFSL